MAQVTGSMNVPLTKIKEFLEVADKRERARAAFWVQFTVNLTRRVLMEIKAAYSKLEKNGRGGIRDNGFMQQFHIVLLLKKRKENKKNGVIVRGQSNVKTFYLWNI